MLCLIVCDSFLDNFKYYFFYAKVKIKNFIYRFIVAFNKRQKHYKLIVDLLEAANSTQAEAEDLVVNVVAYFTTLLEEEGLREAEGCLLVTIDKQAS